MTTFTVTTLADVVDARDGRLSLREAVASANASAGADRILFAARLEGGRLALTHGQLTVSDDVSVDGDRDNNGSRVTIDANHHSRILAITGGGDDNAVALTDLTLTRGGSHDSETGGPGGGILLDHGQSLAMNRCTVSDCFGYGAGGGLALLAGSRTAITDSIIRGNAANEPDNFSGDASKGGGIYLAGAMLTMARSTIAGNHSGHDGGGIWASDSTLVLRNSTVAGNAAQEFVSHAGGGIFADGGSTTIMSSTITGNYAANAYGADGGGIRASGRLSLVNSIVAGNFGGYEGERVANDIAGTIASSNGHNIFGTAVSGNVAGDREGVAASLLFAAIDPGTGGGRLAANGGPTPTVALRDAPDNPALGGADPAGSATIDQRGFIRPAPAGSDPDIGSFELRQTTASARFVDGDPPGSGAGEAAWESETHHFHVNSDFIW
ncbi:choice-of-anchor Q domain-containing protein [Benzoatithermus flavus]|uniref:CSLREA domain-containing protein n=1 Tax=Benzoatithermus flavus TaxID=3108223 RepID=A0ABU8XTL8_9PROT